MQDAATNDADVTDAEASLDGDLVADAQLPVIPAAYECDVTRPATVRVHTVPHLGSALLLVHDVFGEYVTRAMSGAAGDVTLTVPGCGAVTIVRLPTFMSTITYVGDGDELWIEGFFTNSPDRGPAKIHVAAPIADATYGLAGPFAGDVPGPLTQNVYWHDEVLDAQNRVSVAFHTMDPGGNRDPKRWALFEDVRLADFQQTPLEVTAWHTESRPFQFRVTLPASAETAGQLANVIRDRNYVIRYTPNAGFLAPTATPTYDFELPSYGDGLRFTLQTRTLGTQNSHFYVERLAMPTAGVSTIDRDLTTELLPEVTSVTVTPAFDRPTVQWTIAAGDAEDTVTVSVSDSGLGWSFVLPPGMRQFRFPELPADLAHDFSSLSTTRYGVGISEATDFPGYAYVRNHSTQMLTREDRAAGVRIRAVGR